MGIKLSFEITSPLGPDDKDLLTGVSIMTLAIANNELAKEHFPGVFPDDEDLAPEDDEHEAPTTPPSSPPQARDAQDRDEEIQRLLEEAMRRGREAPGATTVLVPSKRIGAHFPQAFSDAAEAMEEQPCSARDPADPSRICVSKVAHTGRHTYRPLVGSSGVN